ncbi:hypothetical protein ACJX0J_040724 [Zea mays]
MATWMAGTRLFAHLMGQFRVSQSLAHLRAREVDSMDLDSIWRLLADGIKLKIVIITSDCKRDNAIQMGLHTYYTLIQALPLCKYQLQEAISSHIFKQLC